MKTKLTKKELKEIRQFSQTIPTTFYEANAKVTLTAGEILKLDDENLIDLQKYIANNQNTVKSDTKFTLEKRGLLFPVNHYNQLKNIYYRSNKNELAKNVQNYIDAQVQLFESMNKPIELHSRII